MDTDNWNQIKQINICHRTVILNKKYNFFFPLYCLLFSPSFLNDAKKSAKAVCQPHGTIWTNKVPETDIELK